MTHHLAQINIARLVAPMDDPRIAAFAAQLDAVNALAERAAGFVWRLKSESGNATDVPFGDDPLLLVNMSVWESVEALHAFTYGSGHVEVFRERARWFEKPTLPTHCLWWIRAGHIPTVGEGQERLTYYQRSGVTPYAFTFSQRYPSPTEDNVYV